MNPRERYLETLRFGHPDHVPLSPGGPRESTLVAWHTQGLPQDANWVDAMAAEIGVPREAFDSTAGLPDLTKMIPTFEEKVLEHRDGHYIVQDWMGAITEISDRFDYTYIRSAKDFVTRHWHSFPVQSRADWEEKIRWRYDPARSRPLLAGVLGEGEGGRGVGQGGHHLDQRPLLADARMGGHGRAVRDDGG